MTPLLKDIVILGGGTAGWMAATYLARAFAQTVRITVIEAGDTIGRIGVGEATIPNLQRAFFDFLGIPEAQWMRRCNASFKVGIKFVNWREEPRQHNGNHFYHVFGQLQHVDSLPLSHYWMHERVAARTRETFDYACYKEPRLLDLKLSPRRLDGSRAMHYAWHFDANLVADYLAEVAVGWGVQHVVDEVESVQLADNGHIHTLKTRKGNLYTGDLFIDCTGFRGRLINQVLHEPFIDMSDYLLCDSAIATQLPSNDARDGINPYTTSTALDAGWAWNIPLRGRFGTGYVHSSKFVSADDAARELCQLHGIDANKVPFWNKIRFRVGRNRRAWVKNCVSLGLASNFLEPLESTGLYLIYAALYQLVKHFPDKSFDAGLIDAYNKEIEYSFDDCRDFIQAHYFTTARQDTAFWRANRHDLKISDAIKEKLAIYDAGLPVNMVQIDGDSYYGNFETEFRNFWTNGNYYCILSGMGRIPAKALPAVAYRPSARGRADEIFLRLKQEAAQLEATLPSNYDFLNKLHRSPDEVPKF
jgi:hypothetical protein